MVSPASLKVSYCTTCMGRLQHLKETLPQNLAAEKDNPNVEFVILSYGKDPEMDEYMHQYDAEIASGRIKYVVYPDAEHFHYAHSRNMVHRLGSGDILCGLDADNILAPNYSVWLQQQFASNPDIIISHSPINAAQFSKRAADMLLGKEVPHSNLGGRVAITKKNFLASGYNEGFDEEGVDKELATRVASKMGLEIVRIPPDKWGSFIPHTDKERYVNLPPEQQGTAKKRIESSKPLKYLNGLKTAFKKVDEAVNPEGRIGCGNVYVNFSDTPTAVLPLAITEKIIKARGSAEPYNAVPLKNDWRTDVSVQKEQVNRDAFKRL